MNSLTKREKLIIKREFNNQGWVLDFSNSTFAAFTIDSIGYSVQDKYKLSKGASLDCFFMEEEDYLAGKLLNDLIKKRKDDILFSDAEVSTTEEALLAECQTIADKLLSIGSNSSACTMVQELSFCSLYVDQQVSQMCDSIESNPTDAIGKAKDLLESCMKTILKERGIQYSRNIDFNELTKTTLAELKLNRDSVPDDRRASETIKNTLSSLSTIINNVNDLRNSYGSGHGRENDYSGLSPRHARLVVGLASSAVVFLWDTHVAMQKHNSSNGNS